MRDVSMSTITEFRTDTATESEKQKDKQGRRIDKIADVALNVFQTNLEWLQKYSLII